MGASIEQPSDSATEFAALQFIIQSMLARMGTCTLVKVISCTNMGGLAAWGMVNVQPLISQVSGGNTAVQHGQLFRLPYLRIQGGNNAVIIDPAVGDIGLAVFAARDISSLKTQEAIDQVKSGRIVGVTPASKRQFSQSDGLYVGGYLNAAPTQYVRMGADEIEIVSPTKIVMRAPNVEIVATASVSINGATVAIEGSTSASLESPTTTIANATIDGKVFLAHAHTGVETGTDTSGGVA